MNGRTNSSIIAGLSAIGALVVGVASFIAGFFPLFSGEFSPVGILWIASAVSFGLLANALFRD